MRSAFALVTLAACAALAQELPAPTGPYAVGRIGYQWTDAPRSRDLMVYFWYPAERATGAPWAAYLPGAPRMDAMPEIQARLRRLYAARWPEIVSGALHSHAREGAPVAKTPKPLPVVIFSHGAGNSGFNSSGLLEDLASRGYVVAAIEHPGAAQAVWYPDGRVVPVSQDAPGASIARGIDEGAADVRFVADRIVAANREPGFLLAGRLDPARLAAMGHSAGAEFAARACQLDARFRACVDLDGGMVPIAALPLFDDGAKMKPPLLLLEAYHPESTMGGLSHERIAEYYRKREEQLQACPHGTYAVVLRSPGIAHPSFTDIPSLLAGRGDYPPSAVVRHNTELIERVIREFLGKTLHDDKAPWLDTPGAAPPDVTVQPYPR
jgi:dienelactone hydrolase